MKVMLNKPIVGYKGESTRVHANEGDILPVILHNPTHYICDSVLYPGNHIVVFPSQCSEVIPEVNRLDEYEDEKYYHVYEDYSKKNLDDPFYSAFDSEDLE